MRKYLDKKAEIETDFQNKADALIDWLRGEYARIAVYRSDVQHEERKKIVEKYEARIGALRTQYIDMEATMFQNAIAAVPRRHDDGTDGQAAFIPAGSFADARRQQKHDRP